MWLDMGTGRVLAEAAPEPKGSHANAVSWQCLCSRAGQGRAEQSRAGQGRAGQGKAGQGRARQGRAGQSRAEVRVGQGLQARAV